MALIIRKITCTLAFAGEDPARLPEAPAGRGLLSPQSLDVATQEKFEQAVGAELGGVKIFSNPLVNQWLDELRADAAAAGSNVFIREGQYELETQAGQGLLAHELTHVAQARTAAPGQEPEDWESAALENEIRIRQGKQSRPVECLDGNSGNSETDAHVHLAAKDRSWRPDRPEVLAGTGAVTLRLENGEDAVLTEQELQQAFGLAARRIAGHRHEFIGKPENGGGG